MSGFIEVLTETALQHMPQTMSLIVCVICHYSYKNAARKTRSSSLWLAYAPLAIIIAIASYWTFYYLEQAETLTYIHPDILYSLTFFFALWYVRRVVSIELKSSGLLKSAILDLVWISTYILQGLLLATGVLNTLEWLQIPVEHLKLF